MSSNRGMGRGLAAILSSGSADKQLDLDVRKLGIAVLEPNPDQPRRQFDEAALQGLANSIAARGVLQPVLVRPVDGGRFELIAGERRWRAAQLAGLEQIPAVVRQGDQDDSLELGLIENMVREDLNPVEEARACATLVDDLGMTREAVGKRIGCSRSAVSNLIRLLELPDDVLELLEAGTLSEGHGRALLLTKDHELRKQLASQAGSAGWTVRELEQRARSGSATIARSAKPSLHPDQTAAISDAAELLSKTFGTEVKVKVRKGGYRAEIEADSIELLLALADGVERRPKLEVA